MNSSAGHRRFGFPAAWLWAGVLFALAPALPASGAQDRPAPASAPASSREYVPLGAWARARQFSLHWLDRDKTVQLTNRLSRLQFSVNSCQAQVNGVTVWLSFPISFQNGAAFICQLDLDQTLQPVLWPAANPSGNRIHTICLDPGHGGSDPGEMAGSRQEKTLTLLLAREVRDQLSRAGFKVFMTRNKDTTVKLPARTDIARRGKADLFVCLHYNSSPEARSDVHGIESYCLTPAGATSSNAQGEGDTRWVAANRNNDQNLLLAYLLQKSLVRELSADDRGVRRARFQVLREANMPAVLIEGGFMSHPVEGRKILDAAYRRQTARAIVDGILAYKRIVNG